MYSTVQETKRPSPTFRGRGPSSNGSGSGTELIRTSVIGQAGRKLLVVEPAVEDLDLAEWIRGHATLAEQFSLEAGPVVFRGFPLGKGDFSRVAAAVSPELFQKARSIYAVSEFTASKKLLWHNDGNADLSRWPRKILLYCARAADSGGETTVVDSRRILQAMDRTALLRFSEQGLLYVRNYWEALGHDWRKDFEVNDRAEMEACCRCAGIDCEWVAADHLRLKWQRPATRIHPDTGENVWFNLLFLWHPARFDDAERKSLEESFRKEDLPENCFYGDGSEIDKTIVAEIGAIHEELEVAVFWRANDVLLFDNMLYVHARNPFSGERHVKLAMRNPVCA